MAGVVAETGLADSQFPTLLAVTTTGTAPPTLVMMTLSVGNDVWPIWYVIASEVGLADITGAPVTVKVTFTDLEPEQPSDAGDEHVTDIVAL